MANTLLNAQTNISNDTLKELVSESAFIGETGLASVYTHATYGTLVAAFNAGFPANSTISVTENNPQPDDENVVMRDADFQNVRANATTGRVFYVWGAVGSSLTNYREFNRSDLESANVRGAPTTSINPNNWGLDPSGYRVHFWSETTGATLSGSDYSLLNWKSPRAFGIYDFGPVKRVSTNAADVSNSTYTYVYIADGTSIDLRLNIFYK
jgi:hypothetical protein